MEIFVALMDGIGVTGKGVAFSLHFTTRAFDKISTKCVWVIYLELALTNVGVDASYVDVVATE